MKDSHRYDRRDFLNAGITVGLLGLAGCTASRPMTEIPSDTDGPTNATVSINRQYPVPTRFSCNWGVEGNVKNRTDTAYEEMIVNYTVYNQDKEELGTASNDIENLAAHGTESFNVTIEDMLCETDDVPVYYSTGIEEFYIE